MTSFAPGTPPSVIKKFEEEWLNRQKSSADQRRQKPSADQRRYDNLASRTNVSPSQQRLMDRLGKKLGIGAPGIRPPSIPGNFDPDREGLYPGPRVQGGPMPPLVSQPLTPTVNPVSRPPTGGPMNPGPMPPPQPPSIPGGMGGGIGTGGISTGYNTGMPATNTYQNTGGFGSPTGSPTNFFNTPTAPPPAGAAFKKGGAVKAKKMASGGMTAKASPARRGDGIAQRGKTKGRMV